MRAATAAAAEVHGLLRRPHQRSTVVARTDWGSCQPPPSRLRATFVGLLSHLGQRIQPMTSSMRSESTGG